MFNLQKLSQKQDDVLSLELDCYGIRESNGQFQISVGDTVVESQSIKECKKHIHSGIKELKIFILEEWKDLENLSSLCQHTSSKNNGDTGNIFFIRNIKNIYDLSLMFSYLQNISQELKNILSCDISEIPDELVNKFNNKCLKIKLFHYLIMSELYRLQLLSAYEKNKKTAQISGPWSNLDLPMEERMWSAAEDEEYFNERSRARKEQIRYNPEYLPKTGFYFVWQDLSRDPYRFEDMDDDSPYKSRSLMRIP